MKNQRSVTVEVLHLSPRADTWVDIGVAAKKYEISRELVEDGIDYGFLDLRFEILSGISTIYVKDKQLHDYIYQG